jgi:hypothetical protein
MFLAKADFSRGVFTLAVSVAATVSCANNKSIQMAKKLDM